MFSEIIIADIASFETEEEVMAYCESLQETQEDYFLYDLFEEIES